MYVLTIDPKSFEVFPVKTTKDGVYEIFFREEPVTLTEEELKEDCSEGCLVSTERGDFLVLPKDFDPRDDWFEPVRFGIQHLLPDGTWTSTEYGRGGMGEAKKGTREEYLYRLFHSPDFFELVSFEEKGSSYPVQFNWIEK
jgi:hypothetical protein|nr:MAG TPA: hypothetical protein [Caudoviricetes sp.]